ncbi:VWA domain-containing protein [Reichenbachiella carrageenanivorans]|uniref:VWA domain-containing protein n=1 Tax=Reichenbachiella carrageenanivorans TaxID=2979869 RepID=A0ABY6D641_9BACT|nr:VWA domain-containing protein [Reichenbachiella carrageenanivorans]UXX80533.1 VWA domain-containing protein [Reichenbachiella carrageenanivorans]
MKKYYLKKIGRIVLIALVLISCDEEGAEPEPLGAPDDLEASDEFALRVELEWDKVDNAEEYIIYRATYEDFWEYLDDENIEDLDEFNDDLEDEKLDMDDLEDAGFEKIDDTDDHEYIDTDVESSSIYYYFVTAENDDEGPASEIVEGVTSTITTEEAFDFLAEETEGESYNASSASEVSSTIEVILDDHAKSGADLVFLIDNTGSMSDDIANIRDNIFDLLEALPSGVKVGVAEYGDLNVDPSEWFDYIDLTSDYDDIETYLNNLSTTGGGDIPESVYDGIWQAVDVMSWSSSTKMMIVIGDAPPLEGYLTEKTLKDVIEKCTEEGVTTNLYPILVGF